MFVLPQAHLRSTELENTKLSAELQMLKAVELNREVTIAQFQEELERLRACVAQRDSLEKELLAHKADKVVGLVYYADSKGIWALYAHFCYTPTPPSVNTYTLVILPVNL